MSFVCSKAEGFQAAARGLMDSLSCLNSSVVGWAGILFGRRAAGGGRRRTSSTFAFSNIIHVKPICILAPNNPTITSAFALDTQSREKLQSFSFSNRIFLKNQ